MAALRRVAAQAAPLRAQVVDALRDDIVFGRLEPGERLREAMLCERYGVSRTVVREVLRQLETERLVTMLPNRGPIVTVLEESEIVALYEVRGELEGLMGKLFADRADLAEVEALIRHYDEMEFVYLKGTISSRERAKRHFYDLMLNGANNGVLADTVHSIHQRVAIFRHVAFSDDDRVAASMVELGAIVHAAARERDARAARVACENHIRRAGQLAVLEYREWLDRLRVG